MYRYAIINDYGLVCGESNLTGKVNQKDMILISDDFEDVYKRQ